MFFLKLTTCTFSTLEYEQAFGATTSFVTLLLSCSLLEVLGGFKQEAGGMFVGVLVELACIRDHRGL